jgi:hypothetical protein
VGSWWDLTAGPRVYKKRFVCWQMWSDSAQRRRIINKNNKDNSALHIGLTVFGLFEAGV